MFEPKRNMSTTVNVVCYRNKKLSKGESPLMLIICKDRKTKYKSLTHIAASYSKNNKIHPKYINFQVILVV
jgi:hypothetical protein